MNDTLTIAEIAKNFNINPITVYRWIRTGLKGKKLKATAIGFKWVVKRDDLNEFLVNSRSNA
jgi:excisionase family DNA binding protein